MKQWLYRSLFVGLLLALSFSVTAAQDKTTNRQRAALTKILESGSQTFTVGDLLENEDFSGDNLWDTFKSKDSNVRTVDGAYRMTLKGNLYTYGLDSQEHGDTVIEVETSQLSADLNNYYGVICRGATDKEGAGYYFFISGDGYYSIYNGTSKGLDKLVDWTQSDAINQGQADNSVVVVCVNDYLALYANGTLLTEVNDSTFTTGLAGFTVGASENTDVDVNFDNVRLWDVGTGDSSLTPTTPTVELTDFGGKSEDTIAELENLSLIPSGSSLIFGENYAYFTGQGNWFTPLASNQPRTNIVLGGDLTFHIGNADELETCTLTSRIDTNSKGTAVTYLDVGLVNDGSVFIFDKFSESGDPNYIVGTEAVDLGEQHNFVLLLIDDKANLFVDGKLMIQDFEVVKRPGTYGIALLGKGKDAKCEGRNIWAYQIPASTTGECTVNSSKNINKRSGPGTSFDNAGQLKAGTDAAVTGQAKGSDGLTWWQLDDDSWVREDVVTETGDCTSVPIVKR